MAGRIRQKLKRLRRMAVPLACLAFTFYFLFFLIYGERSFTRLSTLKQDIAQQEDTLAKHRKTHQRLEHRTKALRTDSLDLDLLDERARFMLHYSDPRDLVIMHERP